MNKNEIKMHKIKLKSKNRDFKLRQFPRIFYFIMFLGQSRIRKIILGWELKYEFILSDNFIKNLYHSNGVSKENIHFAAESVLCEYLDKKSQRHKRKQQGRIIKELLEGISERLKGSLKGREP